MLGALALMLIWVAGRFVGFLNLSSLHTFYASRLTRAYLGASNGRRFSGASDAKGLSVTEPLPGDDIALDTYYVTETAGPLHLINVTMNLTVDPAEQLVQRDRKGKPLCLAPHGWTQFTKTSGAPRNLWELRIFLRNFSHLSRLKTPLLVDPVYNLAVRLVATNHFAEQLPNPLIVVNR